MKQQPLPTYHELDEALCETPNQLHASQVHGLMSGMLSANPALSSSSWGSMIGDEEGNRALEILQALCKATAQQLEEFLFEFQLVLPDDTASLPVRAEALILWCQGFLTGLKASGVQVEGRDAGEMTEAMSDLLDIAKINYEDVVDCEEDGVAYTDLVEYVRMAVVLIYQVLREEQRTVPPSQAAKYLH